MNITHTPCGSDVKLDLARTMGSRLLAGFSITQNGVTPTLGDVVNLQDGSTPVFFCTTCKKEVGADDVSVLCMQCGESIPVSNARIPSKSRGTYCPNCVKIFEAEGERAFLVSTAIKKLNITRGE